MKIKESLNVTFDETHPPSKTSPLVDADLDEEEAIKVTKKKNLENDIEGETLEVDKIVKIWESKNHPLDNVIGNLNLRTLRGCHSTSSSSFAFNHPSSSHHVDDDNDEEDEGTSRASTPSPTSYVNSLSNDVPQVFTNPPHDEQDMSTLFTNQTKIINRQVQMRDEHRSGLKLTGKGIKNLWKGKKK
ncbi:hypothetical protein Tco_1067769 [Tanacetum coccineum]|uniref:Uncharacterized protein n=1 Tax=Tanacetum coccineum TaxID=301880 RepID=A0ABQ5HFH2_9ASTR